MLKEETCVVVRLLLSAVCAAGPHEGQFVPSCFVTVCTAFLLCAVFPVCTPKKTLHIDRTQEREMGMHALDSHANLKQFRYPYFLGHGSTSNKLLLTRVTTHKQAYDCCTL